MKPGVRRDLRSVLVFAGGIALWFVIGFLLLPVVPEADRGNKFAEAAVQMRQRAFIDWWGKLGLGVSVILLLLQTSLQAFAAGRASRDADAPAPMAAGNEKPEDSYLPPAVGWGILIGLLVLVAGLVFIAAWRGARD